MSDDQDESGTLPDTADEEPQPEWYKARNEVERKSLDVADVDHPVAVQTGSTDSIEQKIEEDVVLDYLSDKIYGGPDATIREYIANAETALVRAARLDLSRDPNWSGDLSEMRPTEILDESSISPSIEVEWHRDERQLVIRDNGIGFTPAEITEVLAWTGRSGVRDDGTVSGQFGMGVLSFVKATSNKGGMTMFTRTRRKDVPEWAQESFSMYIELGDYNMTDGSLPEGQYGTRFEIPLKSDIEETHSTRYTDSPVIRRWVNTYAEWVRVPVLYEEYEDGEIVHDDEFPRKRLAEDFDGARIEIDRDEFRAISYPDADKETILVNVPIERNGPKKPGNSPWYVDIRLRNESGVVVDCDSDPTSVGMQVVDSAEYEEMSQESRDRHVVENDLPDDAVITPRPTASRDGLGDNSQFWSWLGEQIAQRYAERIDDCFSDIDSPQDIDDLAANDPETFSFMMKGVEKALGYRSSSSMHIQNRLSSKYSVFVSDEIAEYLERLTDSVSHAPRGRNGVSRKRNRTSKSVWYLHREAMRHDAEVFMGVNINEDRCKVAWETDDHNHVVRVEDTSDYPRYSSLGFKKLKNVPLSDTADTRFTIPSSMSSDGSTSNAGKPARERSVTVRTGESKKKTLTAKRVRGELQKAQNNSTRRGVEITYGTYVDELVLFPSDTDRNISEHYSLGGDGRGLAKCTVMVYEYLKDVPGVMHIDDLIEDAEDVEIETNEGTTTVGEAGDQLLVHVVSEGYLDKFRDPDVMDHLAEWFHDKLEEPCKDKWNYEYEDDYPDKFVYAPVSKGAWSRIEPSTLDNHFIVVSGDLRPLTTGSAFSKSLSSDAEIYAVGRFPDWDADSPEIKALRKVSLNADTEIALSIIETMGMMHDSGVDPWSYYDDPPMLETADDESRLVAQAED